MQKTVDSQITRGDRMQTLSKGYTYTSVETFQKAIYYPFLQVVKGQWVAAYNKSYLHAVIQNPFTIFKSVSTNFLKISTNQLIINKKLT